MAVASLGFASPALSFVFHVIKAQGDSVSGHHAVVFASDNLLHNSNNIGKDIEDVRNLLPSPRQKTKRSRSFLKERAKEFFPFIRSPRPAPGPENGEESFCFFFFRKRSLLLSDPLWERPIHPRMGRGLVSIVREKTAQMTGNRIARDSA
jgi:hypothetical protein